MKKVIVAVALLALLNVARAQVNNFTITLSGAAQRPTPNSSTGSGFGTATIGAANAVTYSVTYSGLGSPANAAHIHGPTNANFAADVLFPFSPDPGGTSGTLNQTFTYSAAQIADLRAGLHYFNIHTAVFPGGELRGQVTAVPEPGTLALTALGASLLAFRLRRRG